MFEESIRTSPLACTVLDEGLFEELYHVVRALRATLHNLNQVWK